MTAPPGADAAVRRPFRDQEQLADFDRVETIEEVEHQHDAEFRRYAVQRHEWDNSSRTASWNIAFTAAYPCSSSHSG